jgi:RecJ-like exonuclease
MENKKMMFFLRVVIVVALVTMSQTGVFADCDCWFPDYYIVASSEESDYSPQVNSDGEIGGCRFRGDVPGTVSCQAQGGTSSVVSWQITGAITANMLKKVLGINVSGTVGSTQTKTFSASTTATINSFCKTCHAETGHEYTVYGYTIGCTRCSSWQVDGTYKVYKGQYSRASNGSKPVPPCIPSCSE